MSIPEKRLEIASNKSKPCLYETLFSQEETAGLFSGLSEAHFFDQKSLWWSHFHNLYYFYLFFLFI